MDTDRLMERLAGAALMPDRPHIKLRIPRSHPKAEALLRLARTLATTQKLASGVLVSKVGAPNDNVQEMLNALREFCDVDQVLAFVKAKHPDRLPRTQGEMLSFALRAFPIFADMGVLKQPLT